MNPFFAMFNGWEVVAIFGVILVLFGAKKLPELAKGLGQGIKEFKKSSREIQDDLNNAMDMDTPPPPPRQQIAPQKTEVHVADVVPDATHPTSGQPKA